MGSTHIYEALPAGADLAWVAEGGVLAEVICTAGGFLAPAPYGLRRRVLL
jgi:hypothetical protein